VHRVGGRQPCGADGHSRVVRLPLVLGREQLGDTDLLAQVLKLLQCETRLVVEKAPGEESGCLLQGLRSDAGLPARPLVAPVIHHGHSRHGGGHNHHLIVAAAAAAAAAAAEAGLIAAAAAQAAAGVIVARFSWPSIGETNAPKARPPCPNACRLRRLRIVGTFVERRCKVPLLVHLNE